MIVLIVQSLQGAFWPSAIGWQKVGMNSFANSTAVYKHRGFMFVYLFCTIIIVIVAKNQIKQISI